MAENYSQNQNNCDFNRFSAEDSVSLITMRFQMYAFMMWIFCAVLNLVGGSFTFLVIRLNKALQTDTHTFLQHSNGAVFVASFSFAACAVVHLWNVYHCIPETMDRYRCFLYIGHQSLFLSTANSFTLVITIDRFVATVFPIAYKNRSKTYKRRLVGLVWFFELAIFGSSYFDTTGSKLPVCVFVLVEGNFFFYFMVCKLMSFSLISIVLYLMVAIKLIYRSKKVFTTAKMTTVQEIKTVRQIQVSSISTKTGKDNSINPQQQASAQNNLHGIRQQMNRKILKALMVNTIAQAITFLVAYSKLINGLYQENRDVKIMPYFVNLMMIDAFINFVIYVCYIDQFRRTLFDAILCHNRVVQIIYSSPSHLLT